MIADFENERLRKPSAFSFGGESSTDLTEEEGEEEPEEERKEEEVWRGVVSTHAQSVFCL